jgi:hypothetical protein
MRQGFVILIAGVLCTGCTHIQLSRNTLKQQKTVADLQLQSVLDNVARFAQNSDTLPYFSTTDAGITQISDTGQSSVNLVWNPYAIVSETLGLNANRTVLENWTCKPTTNPDKLSAMRCAYQKLFGRNDVACEKNLKMYYKTAEVISEKIPLDWFCVGCKKEVPKTACYVAHYCDTYVWVMPCGMDGFSRFTLTILDIATRQAPSQAPIAAEKEKPFKIFGEIPVYPQLPETITTPEPQPREMPYPSFGPQFFPQPTQ